jgi:hypothetical protein
MLPTYELHLKLLADKKTFRGTLSTWEVSVMSRMNRVWRARIIFPAPATGKLTEQYAPETYESKLALKYLLEKEGLPTQIGVLAATQTHLSFLDIYSIRVTWEQPPLSPARRLSAQEVVKKHDQSMAEPAPSPTPLHAPPLAPGKRPLDLKHERRRLRQAIVEPLRTQPHTSAIPLWDTRLPDGPPKGAWYEE